MNARNLFEMDCINHLLHFPYWSISLHVFSTIDLLIFHTVLLEVFLVSTGFFLSVHNPPNFERLNAAVSEVEHDDTLDLGKVKLCWYVLIHLTISALQVFGSFPNSEGNGILKIPLVTVI